jgi:NAD(P)-dependent dehydrogenase (short-subunit alcohol dehydrogenase family)
MNENKFSLNGRLALITGGGTGLGLAVARLFVEHGARVVVTGRRERPILDAAKSMGPNATAIVCDITKFDTLPALIEEIESGFGEIDILVNNAGIHIKKGMFEHTDEDFELVTKTNESAVFAMSRETAKRMVARKRGCILMISSMASRYGISKVIGYTAAKSAVEGMTRAMAPNGIRVNCIAPGFIKTDMSTEAFEGDPERKAKVLGRTPLGRLGLPDEVAHAAVFLCSDAASFITGVVLPVDGGNSIGF